MPVTKRAAVSLLRAAARRLDETRADITYGACVALAHTLADRYGKFTDRYDEAITYFQGLLSVYEEDAYYRGPSTAWWGMNFGAYRDWKARMRTLNSRHAAVDAEVAKSGRILMLLFLAEMVEQGDL